MVRFLGGPKHGEHELFDEGSTFLLTDDLNPHSFYAICRCGEITQGVSQVQARNRIKQHILENPDDS